MPRYIDADKLKEDKFVGVQFERYYWIVYDGRANTDDVIYAYKVGYNEAIDNIADFEPTADVVEVVRCKNCKHRDADDFCTGRGYPNALVPDDGFCDKGKRSE